LVAALDRRDHFHAWTIDALTAFETPLSTCDAVLVEAWHLLGRARGGRQALLGLLRSGNLAVTFSIASDGAGALKLAAKYADVPMSITDACLVRMAELDPGAIIVTLDSDFAVYRRGRSALRLAAPFVRI
jgi:predicted nucleic acid-binding protein